MENSKENALNDFLNQDVNKDNGANNRVTLNKKEGLIERVDKVFITEDGRQLLREHY